MVEDTSSHDPRVHLAGMDVEGPSGYVSGMESAGQRELVSSNQLPRQAEPSWDEFEAIGIRRGEDVDGADGLFCEASLPEGWTRQPREHPMWSRLVDERGIERVVVFYKAAFNDREAFMRMIEHPGDVLATAVINGSNLESLPAQWPVLTDTERRDFRRRLGEMHTFIEQHLIEDRGRKVRIESIIRLIDGAQI